MSWCNGNFGVRTFAAALLGFSALGVHAQQAAAPYTYVTRFNASGQVTGTIAPDPDGPDVLGFPATRNTYGSSGTTKGLLTKIETGELGAWVDESVAPESWTSFAPYLTKTFDYDNLARKVKETVLGTDGAAESVVQYSYDDWDRVRCKAVRMNKSAFGSLPSDACTLGTEGSFGPDRITRYTYNQFDLVLTEERAVGTSLAQTYVTNQYELDSRVLRFQTDAKGNKTELQYDDNKRLSRRFYPSPTSPGSVSGTDYNEYGYDNNGNVTFQRKREYAKTITNTFDANNRLIFKDLSDNVYSSDIAYDYDLRGLTLASCFGNDKFDDDCDAPADGEGESNVFDGFGNLVTRISSQDGALRTLTYQYDREGNRTRVTHPDAWFFEYGFDGLNRENSIRESTAASPAASTTSVMSISYRPSGGRLDLIRPSGATTNIDVDNALRLETFTQNLAGTADDLTNGFTYNPASQVATLTQSNTLYNYTEAQNRIGGYGVNGLNQYTQIDGQAMSYDLTGNLTSDGAGNTYTYDMENRLVATGGAVPSVLAYDTLGRLKRIAVGGTTTNFLYDGDALVGEYANGSMTRRYVHGDNIDEPLLQYNGTGVGSSARRYLHADHQGSIIALSNGTGAAIVKNAYDPFGIPASANDGRFGFTGQTWLKEIGLNYYKARMYSPKVGRFLQSDPIFYEGDMNMYAYVGNDPINAADPSGLVCQKNQSGESGCTIDEFKDKSGKAITRDQATASKSDARKIEKLEERLTAKYVKAQELAARGGSVTLKGNSRQKVADERVSGREIVGAMESTKLIAAAGVDPRNANINARTDANVYADGSVKPVSITFFSNGRLGASQTFGHEILHVNYYIKNGTGGWGGVSDPNLHDSNFDDASDDIR